MNLHRPKLQNHQPSIYILESPIGYQNLLQHSYSSHLRNPIRRFRLDFETTVKPDWANHQPGQLPQPWL